MVLKGACRSNAVQAVWYLLAKERGEGETVELIDLQGTLSQDVADVGREWEALALGLKCKKHLYHLSLNTREGEDLTPEQWRRSVALAAANLGLENCPRLVVQHENDGRVHQHVLFSRFNPETGNAVKMWKNYEAHELTARELEKDFGFEHTQGRHVIEAGTERAEPGPTHDEIKQAEKTKVNPYKWRRNIRAIMTQELEKNPDATGKDLSAALEKGGHFLAHGDKVPFLLLDPSGTPHRLAQSLGLKIGNGEFAERFGDIDPATLPTIAAAQELQAAQLAREAAAQAEKEKQISAHKGATLYDNASMAEQQKDAQTHNKDIIKGRTAPRSAEEIAELWRAARIKAAGKPPDRKNRAIGKEKGEENPPPQPQQSQPEPRGPRYSQYASLIRDLAPKAAENFAKTERTDRRQEQGAKAAMREIFETDYSKYRRPSDNEQGREQEGQERERER